MKPWTPRGSRTCRIVVSGGFDAERIHAFEAAGVPADAYGVGSSLLRGNTDFTADVVLVDGRPCAKKGREYRPNPRLEPVELSAAERVHERMAEDGRGRTAVIVVDMLNGFCRFGNLSSPRLGSVVDAHPRAPGAHAGRRGARSSSWPTRTRPTTPSSAMFPPHCVEGAGRRRSSPSSRSSPARGIVVRKRRYSGFFGTDLDGVLARAGARTVWRSSASAPTSACCTPSPTCACAATTSSCASDLVETYDAPGHAPAEVNGFALAHIRDVLGARVE